MPYIAEIVDLINNDLATGKFIDGTRFVRQFNGLVDLQPVNEVEGQRTIPVVVGTKDFAEHTVLNDNFSIQIYHRLISIEQQESPLNYGDGQTNGREVATMRLICFADKRQTKLDQYTLAFLLRSSLNRQYVGAALTAYSGLLGVTIEAKEDNYNGVEVWQNEYGLSPESYPVRMHQCLISVQYTITSDYNNSCITSCLEC